MSTQQSAADRSASAREVAIFLVCTLLFAILSAILGRVWPRPVAAAVAALPTVGAWLASWRTPTGARSLAWPVVVLVSLVAAGALAFMEVRFA